MRTVSSVGLTLASCILFFVACSSDDKASAGAADAGANSSSSSGGGSSGNGASSSGNASSSGAIDAGGDSGLVPVGDGSLGAGCNKDDECNSKVCSVGHKCVISPSCRASTGSAPGVDTCGKAEPGDESCCTSLTLPKTTTRALDKYEITAGRFRAFISSLTNGNVRKWAKDYAAAHPSSQLGKVASDFPAAGGFSAYIDLFPDHAGVTSQDTLLPLWLGAFPEDAINKFDGCYLNADGYGAATYWQDPSVLKTWDIGANQDGKRKLTQAELDNKPVNCMPPIMLAAFCAWDGGELARPSDYYEVWGHDQQPVAPGGALFTSPWETVLPYGQWNWRNGHFGVCPLNYPGCVDNTGDTFYSFPTGGNPAVDDAPEIGTPGRFTKDVTKVKSPDGAGWYDAGGNLLEAAWPKVQSALYPTPPALTVQNYCDTAAGGSGDPATECNRDQPAGTDYPAEPRPGTLRFKGQTPVVALIGSSFEGHFGYGDAYFANATDDETKLNRGFPAHFQYGKVGGRCARPK